MNDERQIPTEWLRGATLDEAGELVTKEFDEDECYSAWYVFAFVRDHARSERMDYPTRSIPGDALFRVRVDARGSCG